MAVAPELGKASCVVHEALIAVFGVDVAMGIYAGHQYKVIRRLSVTVDQAATGAESVLRPELYLAVSFLVITRKSFPYQQDRGRSKAHCWISS